MKRRQLLLSLLLCLSLQFGVGHSSKWQRSVRAAEAARRFPTCVTSSGVACQSLLQWATSATVAAAELVRLAEEEAHCRASIHQQASHRASVDSVAYSLPAWVTFGLVQPRVAADDGLPWVGPLSNDPARSLDWSFAYSAHAWLSVNESAAEQTESPSTLVARGVQRAWTRNMSRLAADERHSTGSDEVVTINLQNEGLAAQPKREVTDEQVRHWFEDYTLGEGLLPHNMIAGLESSSPVRRPAAIASIDDDVVAAIADEDVSTSVEIDGFETVLDGPGRFLVLRAAAPSKVAIARGHVADVACLDNAALAAEVREREARALAKAWMAAAANTINQCGAALIGVSQQLSDMAAAPAEESREERVEVRTERHDAADARSEYRAWSGCGEWDLEAGMSSNPYLGL